MLRLVLRLNFCTFMGVVYRQIVGYATGTACGGQVAHLYLEELLGPIIAAAVASIVIHKRYIDDGFLNESFRVPSQPDAASLPCASL
jgi:hypothetical protein